MYIYFSQKFVYKTKRFLDISLTSRSSIVVPYALVRFSLVYILSQLGISHNLAYIQVNWIWVADCVILSQYLLLEKKASKF